MKITTKDLKFVPGYILVPIPPTTDIDQYNDRLVDVEIKVHRERRSLDANAYLWVLLHKIAVAVKSTKEEIYLQMIKRYGQFAPIVCPLSKAEAIKRTFRNTEDIGEITVNGKTGFQFLGYPGSSTYDTKEMSELIDGVVSECKELGIETLTPQELAKMKEEWK